MDRSLTLASTLMAASTCYGAAVSLRLDIPGEPLRLHVPGTVARHLALGLGSGLSAPWPMAVAALAAAGASSASPLGARRVARSVGWALACGVLVEPVSWGRRARSPLVAASVLLNVASAAGLVLAGGAYRELSSDGSGRG